MIGTRGIIGICIVIGAGLLVSTEPSHFELDESINRFFGDDSSDAELFSGARDTYGSSLAQDDRSEGYTRQVPLLCGHAPLNRVPTLGPRIKPYIVDGQDQVHGEWPSFVLVTAHFNGQPSRCGGVILSQRRILTAAHCVTKDGAVSDKIVVELGAHNLTNGTPQPANVVCMSRNHTKEEARFRDWALLETAEPIQFTAYIQPACLPSGGPNELREYRYCHLIGAGATGFGESGEYISPQVIQKLIVRKMSCANVTESRYRGREALACWRGIIGGSTLPGDTGGPILCLDMADVRAQMRRWTVVAIATNDKDRTVMVGIYAAVRELISQIKEAGCEIL